MKKSLVLVESPTKAKTITRFLDPSFKIISSMGHIIDLPKNRLGIDIENGFTPQYKVIKGREKVAKAMKKEAEGAEKIYLATDPDREGEAISWHIKNLLEGKKKKEFLRVIFHEITEEAIKEAFAHPLKLDIDRVNAQQSRRILDRIVGYFLSPFLWKRICRGLSAGRVQSVALRFIVDREREIAAFNPKKYYTIEAYFEKDGIPFRARLVKEKGRKITLEDKAKAEAIEKLISGKEFVVKKINRRVTSRKPYPPFITSSLQQEAFRTLRFASSRTMLVAQKLYEGIETKKEGLLGLITYMRTDSFHISPQAKKEAKKFILENFGESYLAGKEYKFKSKGIVQAAHEAIRPTKARRRPEVLELSLSNDEARLYELIWKRFVACFMSQAKLESTQIILECEGLEFAANGTRLLFDGFLKVYPEKIKEDELPKLNEKESISPSDIKLEEKSTLPPARFNDASLVRTLEEKGIGRPSTYAPTIWTLLRRNYLKREKAAFIPTDLGIAVIDLLVKFFSDILDEQFTARMEKDLDYIEKGDMAWQKILEDFYPAFKKDLEEAENKSEKQVEYADRTCEKCGRPMIFKHSRRGRFISCSGYPQCKNAHPITTGIKCPECKEGELIERRNRKGQNFYGCSKFPQCRFTASNLSQITGSDSKSEGEEPEIKS